VSDISTEATNAQIHFEAIFEHSPNIVVYTGLERELVRVNRRFVEASGYTEEECLGRTTRFLYARAEDYGQTGRNRYNYNVDVPLQEDAFVLEYRRKDGSTFLGETIGVPLHDSDDQVLGYMAVVRDLTEQLEFEAERRRMLEELERSRAFLAETERIARIGGAELDVTTGRMNWSEGLYRLFGLFEGTTPSLEQALAHYEAEGRAEIVEALEGAAMDGQPFDMEHRFVDAKERQMWVRTAASPVYEDGDVSAVRGFVQDITAQKQAEQEKLEFLALVSHELRSPLTALLGTLELMKTPQGRSEAGMNRLVAMALRSGERLGELIDDILDVRKLESGQMTLELDLFDVCDVVEDVVMANRGFAQALEVDLRVDCSVDQSDVCLDAGRLEQVLTNLISNAIKFSPAGEVVDVEAETSKPGRVRISVLDRGPGIPEHFRGELFEKFTQAASGAKSRSRGTGLGLTIAKRLTEAMGGRIDFETAQGEGTTMYVEFPTAL
jgi:PAS domain S-box-containing protein